MKSIRRLYFYLVALISIEVIVWGLISLLRSMIDQTISGGADALAQALALILVGVPIFLIHWLWAQRISARDEEEKSSTLRAVFLYGILLGTLIPVVQNFLSFLDRALVQITGLGVERAFSSFRGQTLADNLIAIIMNGIVAAYFWNVLRDEWATLTDKENFSEVRRLYRYIWMLYGLLMTIFGLQQVIRFLFYIPGDVLGELGREVAVNGLALILVGTPIWIYSWRLIQESLSDLAEMGSNLRLGILYILALGGVITVITTATLVVNVIVARLLGNDATFSDFIREIGDAISIGVPLGMIWAYYGYWLNRHIAAIGDKVREAALRRLYYYILSFIGLVVAFSGVGTLLNSIINLFTSSGLIMSNATRELLSAAIAFLIVGLPLWLLTWQPMQAEALAQGEVGDHARRSVIRKFYLYLALFASVIGGMVSAVTLVYQLLRVVLTGDTGSDFVSTLLNSLQLLFLFGVVLVYHLNILRRDGAALSDSLAEKQSVFSTLLIDSGDGFVDAIKSALVKSGSKVQVTVATPAEKPQGEFSAIVLSGNSAINAPEWIRSFGGSRIIVQNEAPKLVWAENAVQAAQSVQSLAEGQEIQIKKPTRSVWMIVVYVLAAFSALELLFVLLAVGISLIAR
jgi:uncharacterized protein DUF5671